MPIDLPMIKILQKMFKNMFSFRLFFAHLVDGGKA